jgi:O-antigen/teichoic acid export membrane protein
MSVRTSLSSNTSYLTIAAVLQKIISALFFFLVSWFIGSELTAAYFNIFAAIAIFTVVADFGMNNVLTREAARDLAIAPRVFSQALRWKVMFGILSIIALGVAKFSIDYPGGAVTLCVVAAVTLWFDSIRSLLYSYLRAHKNVQFEAIGLVGTQIFITSCGIVLLVVEAPLLMLVSLFMMASILQTVYAVWSVRRFSGVPLLLLPYEPNLSRLMLKEAVPFALAGIFAQLYAYQDAVVIHRYLPAAVGGDWARAYKMVYAFQLIPVSLGASIYPVVSSAVAVQNTDRIIWIFKRSYEYLTITVLPIMVGITCLAPALFTEYIRSFVPSLPIYLLSGLCEIFCWKVSSELSQVQLLYSSMEEKIKHIFYPRQVLDPFETEEVEEQEE